MTRAEIFNSILAIIGLIANVMGIISFIGTTDSSFLKYSYSILNLITFYSIFVITWLILRKKYKDYRNGKTQHRAEYSIIKTSVLVGLIFLPIHIYIGGFFVIFDFIFYSIFTSFIIKYMMPIIFEDMRQFLNRGGEYICNTNFTYKKSNPIHTKTYEIKKDTPFCVYGTFLSDIISVFEGGVLGYIYDEVDNEVDIPKEHLFRYFNPKK